LRLNAAHIATPLVSYFFHFVFLRLNAAHIFTPLVPYSFYICLPAVECCPRCHALRSIFFNFPPHTPRFSTRSLPSFHVSCPFLAAPVRSACQAHHTSLI
jgi:hypothetical protein